MQQIVIETAKHTHDKGFVYSAWQAFPSSAKGLTLAVIAAERMMNIDAYHIPHADIRISFKDGQQSDQLADAKFFDLIKHHRHRFDILESCERIMTTRAAASIERTNKIKIVRAAVEDLIEAGFSISFGENICVRNADWTAKYIAEADLNATVIVHKTDGRGRVQNVGHIQFVDGANHEIFGVRFGPFDDFLDRAFGLINEANDYGEITDYV